jgi:Fic family protein
VSTVSDITLRHHVLESNAIEQIYDVTPGDPFLDDHLEAARMAAAGEIVHPNILHKILCRRLPEIGPYAGVYRDVEVCIEYQSKVNDYPHPDHVKDLMDEWWGLVEEYKMITTNCDELSFLLHNWFLCIHPYRDGNGRVARLIWNMLPMNKGLTWFIQEEEHRHTYYEKIIDFEERCFKVQPNHGSRIYSPM